MAEQQSIHPNEECNMSTCNSCGDNCQWIFDETTKTLFIKGSGKMADHKLVDDVPTAPWYPDSGQIANVVIDEGITAIGKYAFYGCSSLTSITIPKSVTKIRNNTFQECSSLKHVVIPKKFKENKKKIFTGCPKLLSGFFSKIENI